MQIVFLGTASCYPTKNRGVSCTAVKFEDGDIWLFDCGEASQVQIQKSSLHLVKVKKIFITHLHGDHLFGLPGLLCSLGTIDRPQTHTLEIYGPLGLRRYVRESLNLSRSPLNYKYIVHELIPTEDQYTGDLKQWTINELADTPLHPQEILGNQIYNTEDIWTLFETEAGCSMRGGALVHRVPSFGYVLQSPAKAGSLDTKLLTERGLPPGPLYGRLKAGHAVTLPNGDIIKPSEVLGPPSPGLKITILGDTSDSSRIAPIAMDSDVLIHEATLEDSMMEKAVENGHSTPSMAAQFAQSIQAKRLILFHFSQRYKLEEEPSVEILQTEAEAACSRLGFTCQVTLASDLLEVNLSRARRGPT